MSPKLLMSLFALALAFKAPVANSMQYHCVSFEYPPLIHREADGHITGAAVEIVQAVFQRIGDSVDIQLYPWGRALSLIQQGDGDCIFTIYHAPDRERYIDYSTAVLFNQAVYLYARRDSALEFDGNLTRLTRSRIGTAARVNYGPRFEAMRSQMQIDEAPTIALNFMKLAMGRVDLVPSNDMIASATLTNAELSSFSGKLIKLPNPLEIVPSYLGFSKLRNLSALRDRYDEEFRKFAVSSEYRSILAKYHLSDQP